MAGRWKWLLCVALWAGACRTAAPVPTPSSNAELSGLDPEISQMVEVVSEERVARTVETLVGFRARHSCGAGLSAGVGIVAARDYVRGQLSSISGLNVLADPYPQPKCLPPVDGANIVALLPGADPRRLIVVGGHVDSVAFSGRAETRETERFTADERPAPGANDSGSQTAVVLEAARAMAGHRFATSVAFVAFSGEEQGLVGSKALAQHVQSLFPGARVEAMLDCDIVGGDRSVNDEVSLHQFRLYAPGAPREAGRAPDGVHDSTSPSRSVMRFVGYWGGRYVPSMTALPRLREDRIGRGGDHSSFIAEGMPAVRLIEAQENVTHQHTGEDTVANMTPAYAARIAQFVVSATAALARAPQAPTSFQVQAAGVGRIHATWNAVPGALRYAVAVRPAEEPYYRLRVETTESSLDAAVKDFGIVPEEPFFISVAALDANRHESLFAYPEIRCDRGTCAAPPGALEPTAVIK